MKSNSQIGNDLKKTDLQINELDLKILSYEHSLRMLYTILSKLGTEFNWAFSREIKHTPIEERSNYKSKCKEFLCWAGFSDRPTEQELIDKRVSYTHLTPYITEIIEKDLNIAPIRFNLFDNI